MSNYPPLTAGVDEAGRGALCGPVMAAAVILNPLQPVYGLKDSKKLSAKKRELLYQDIIKKATAFYIAEATTLEIDQLNILQASLLAMKRAIQGLSITPTLILVDGNQSPLINIPTKTIIQGDTFIDAISAASILAKVYRDHIMTALHTTLPQYHIDKHKGYPTRLHCLAIKQYGPSTIHRRTFKPVSDYLNTPAYETLSEEKSDI
ncbi:MAG: ribonuclease HII [Endozoicomonadaceae bacterium]|nr:ribonuclease HII [Endozoicomonadaceae bacterium]